MRQDRIEVTDPACSATEGCFQRRINPELESRACPCLDLVYKLLSMQEQGGYDQWQWPVAALHDMRPLDLRPPGRSTHPTAELMAKVTQLRGGTARVWQRRPLSDSAGKGAFRTSLVLSLKPI